MSVRGWVTAGKKFISENEEGAEMKKKMGYLQVILMIGCIPMLATMVALTVYASGKMKDELVDSTYLRLKACATSVEQYFTWDIREDILEKDDISYQFIDSLQDEHIEQTLFMEDERFITSIVDQDGNRAEKEQADIGGAKNGFDTLSQIIEANVTTAGIIAEKTKNLEELKQTIINSITELSAISEENAASNEEVTANVSDIAESVNKISDDTGTIKKVSTDLEELMQYFK